MARIERAISGVTNIPSHGKFAVHLECGHTILYDHTVDAASEYCTATPQRLRCRQCESCQKEKQQ